MLFLLFPSSAPDPTPTPPPCHIEQSAGIAFSGGPAPDKLLVSVHGDPCWEGTARIVIMSASGELLYQHEQRFKPLTSSNWSDPELPIDAERFVSGTIENGLKLSKLPAWQPPEEFYEQNYMSVAVSREQYDSIRERNLPVFYHQTYYEGGVSLVYDPISKHIVVVTEGGL